MRALQNAGDTPVVRASLRCRRYGDVRRFCLRGSAPMSIELPLVARLAERWMHLCGACFAMRQMLWCSMRLFCLRGPAAVSIVLPLFLRSAECWAHPRSACFVTTQMVRRYAPILRTRPCCGEYWGSASMVQAPQRAGSTLRAHLVATRMRGPPFWPFPFFPHCPTCFSNALVI